MNKTIIVACWVMGAICLALISFILVLEAYKYDHITTVIQQQRYTK